MEVTEMHRKYEKPEGRRLIREDNIRVDRKISNSCCSRRSPVVAFCEGGTEPSVLINDGEFID
jgi:hypothetical protein